MAEEAIHVAADFVGVAIGVEFFLDVGAFGPFPAVFLHLGVSAGFFEGETLLFDGEALGGEVAPAESGEIIAEVAKAAQFDFGVVLDGGQGTGDSGVTDLEATDEFGAHFFEDRLIEVVREGVFGEVEGGVGDLPVVEAGFFPIGEILGADGGAFEFGGENKSTAVWYQI